MTKKVLARAIISNPQARVAEMRKRLEGRFPLPSIMESWAYLVTEVAEVGDILLRLEAPDHKRNHEEGDADELTFNLFLEIGDVQMMLATLATQLSIDLTAATHAACSKLEHKHGE